MPDLAPHETADSPLFDLGLSGPHGDAASARNFAEMLLTPVCGDRDRRDARLLLTVACLHLQSRNGPEPTLADLVWFLDACRCGQVSLELYGDPLSITDYAVSELGSLAPEHLSLAIEMALAAAKLAQASL